MRSDPEKLIEPLRRLHALIRDAVVASCERCSPDELARIARDGEGDTIYAVDRVSEDLLIDFFERELAPRSPLVLIAEGLAGGRVVLPRGAAERDAAWRVIVDPIDGTRGLMYQKRSAWILTGVAPNLGPATGLQDIVLAVQRDPARQAAPHDVVWGLRGRGARATRPPWGLSRRPSRSRTWGSTPRTTARSL